MAELNHWHSIPRQFGYVSLYNYLKHVLSGFDKKSITHYQGMYKQLSSITSEPTRFSLAKEGHHRENEGTQITGWIITDSYMVRRILDFAHFTGEMTLDLCTYTREGRVF
ncbi:MAG: hypothetical protein H0U76_25495 [Ktedonobacteraceae bacterium]|nr:hypothetical protein [Ktedonobacteraceae bacterium]